MGMTRRDIRAPPLRRRKKRPRWVVGGATILTFVALLYLVELIDQLTGHSLDANGIRPLETDGLWGIIFAPVLHASWQHSGRQYGADAGAGISHDAGRIVPVRLGHRDRLDPRRLRHLAHRQLWAATAGPPTTSAPPA